MKYSGLISQSLISPDLGEKKNPSEIHWVGRWLKFRALFLKSYFDSCACPGPSFIWFANKNRINRINKWGEAYWHYERILLNMVLSQLCSPKTVVVCGSVRLGGENGNAGAGSKCRSILCEKEVLWNGLWVMCSFSRISLFRVLLAPCLYKPPRLP